MIRIIRFAEITINQHLDIYRYFFIFFFYFFKYYMKSNFQFCISISVNICILAIFHYAILYNSNLEKEDNK